jgi:hypothetical protein
MSSVSINNHCRFCGYTYYFRLDCGKHLMKAVRTGSKLSFDEAASGWIAGYNTMSAEQAKAADAQTTSGGSGTNAELAW